MNAIAKYEPMRNAIAKAETAEAVMSVRDRIAGEIKRRKAAQDKEAEAELVELQLIADRRLGQMIMEAKKEGHFKSANVASERVENPTRQPDVAPMKLAEVGVSKDLSARSQKLASMSDDEFKETVELAREKVVTPKGKKTVKVLDGSVEYLPDRPHTDADTNNDIISDFGNMVSLVQRLRVKYENYEWEISAASANVARKWCVEAMNDLNKVAEKMNQSTDRSTIRAVK